MNSGVDSWPVDTKMAFMDGADIGDVGSCIISKEEVKAGQSIEVIMNFKAPSEPGEYCAIYRLTHSSGEKKFGGKLWCDIKVIQPLLPLVEEEEDLLHKLQRELSMYCENLEEKDPRVEESKHEEDGDNYRSSLDSVILSDPPQLPMSADPAPSMCNVVMDKIEN